MRLEDEFRRRGDSFEKVPSVYQISVALGLLASDQEQILSERPTAQMDRGVAIRSLAQLVDRYKVKVSASEDWFVALVRLAYRAGGLEAQKRKCAPTYVVIRRGSRQDEQYPPS